MDPFWPDPFDPVRPPPPPTEHAINPATDRILPGSLVPKDHAKRKRELASERHWRIADAAYYLAEKRGFEPGRELEDWFKAESLIPEAPPGR